MLNFVMVILLCGSGGVGCAANNVPLVFENKIACDKVAEAIEKKASKDLYGYASVSCIQQ